MDMDPTQKKCMIGSAVTHSALLVTALLVSAFAGRETPPKEITPITIFNLNGMKLTDGETRGGGAPTVAAAPPAPRQPTPPAPVTPPPPEPPAPRPVRTETPVVPDPPQPVVRHPRVAAPDIEPKADGEITSSKKPTPATEKTKPKLDLKLVNRDTSKQKAAEAKRIAEQKAAEAHTERMAQVSARFNQTVSGITSDLSPGLTLNSMPGFGGSGEAQVNYGQAILGLYNNAWNPPPDIQDDSAVVGTKIVIAASGKVISADIIKRSGTPALDRSVQRALDAVRRVPPFPEGAKDLERTFKIEFNLKAKRALG